MALYSSDFLLTPWEPWGHPSLFSGASMSPQSRFSSRSFVVVMEIMEQNEALEIRLRLQGRHREEWPIKGPHKGPCSPGHTWPGEKGGTSQKFCDLFKNLLTHPPLPKHANVKATNKLDLDIILQAFDGILD
ncbi:hypothetical protein HJG60_011609 [Phyllostomus discolor]|uniref:Uncharacterized protein n=1 Tax=Phyllostomus discolor TaxID=89673 RepID=A0A833ZW49_9CHIR|nr:hypothetical protein HJG60_011609 [Phyllostomus discolor]